MLISVLFESTYKTIANNTLKNRVILNLKIKMIKRTKGSGKLPFQRSLNY